MRSPPGPTPLPSPLSTQSTARRHASSILPACFNLLRGNDGDLVMPKLDFQGSEHPGFYQPELGIALQNELRALADIECIYEEQRDGLERSALPPSIKSTLPINWKRDVSAAGALTSNGWRSSETRSSG
jgi:hypothetical protein